MNFTTKDIKETKAYYLKFLEQIKLFLLTNNIKDIETQFSVIYYLLKNAYLTDDYQMLFYDKYKFLSLPSDLSDGIQITMGICCCRHATEFLYDLLYLLDYKPKLLFIKIEANGDWLISNTHNANHVVVSIICDNKEIILDLLNDLIFTRTQDGNIKSLKIKLDCSLIATCNKYNDEANIKSISKTLKKYYNLRNLGVKYVFDE